MKRILILPLLLCTSAPAVSADKPSAKDKWTVDDVLFAETAGDFQFAPNGKWVVWTKSVMSEDWGESITHLMRTDLTTHEEVVLTRGDHSCTSPRWSPDGKTIAFLSDRTAPTHTESKSRANRRRSRPISSPRQNRAEEEEEEAKQQVWLINPFGGEAWPLTDCKRGVIDFAWAGSDGIVFVAQEDETHYEQKIKKDEDTSKVVEDEKHEPPARLFRIEVDGKKTTRLTENADQIEYLAVSPDGKWAVARHNRSLRYAFDSKIKPVYLLHDLKSRTSRTIFVDKSFNISSVKWQLDGKGFFAVNDFNSKTQFNYPAVQRLHFFDLAGGSEREVDLQWDNGLAAQDADEYAPGYAVTPDGFIALLANGVRHKLAKYTRAGDRWQRDWLEGEHAANVFGLAVSADGKSLIYAHSTASSLTQWHHATLRQTLIVKNKPIATMNEALEGKPFAKSETIRWKGALDEEVEGLLFYPHDHASGRKHPLVVMIHGGPAGADLDMWNDSWAYAINLYCQRGAFVLMPNYHGSSNYGLKWMESIAGGNYYDLEAPDIEKGVDHLIAKGLVDKDKLGAIGWSNGSILAIELTVRTTRYKAISAGAGDVDWVSDWGNCEFGAAFDHFYFSKSPLEDPQTYIRKSPFWRLDKCRTPTLIFFGEKDRAVPTQQGWMHYRALQHLGKTDVRFVLFPGEEHSPAKLVHQRRKLQEELDWFDKHLFNTAKAKNESLKDDSPLANVLKRHDAKRDGGLFGVMTQGKLLPEIVVHGETRVGRFEVTRAQFKAFDPTYEVRPGTENYPANGISFERAKAYCTWLGKLTGNRYRLPNEEEAEELYAEAEEGANTLDHWAGYKPNPDDARRLREKLSALGKASLLREVGAFSATGDAGVFDLGGNVAEWTTTSGRKGKLMGGSADQPADDKIHESKAALDYSGFRVIRDDTPVKKKAKKKK